MGHPTHVPRLPRRWGAPLNPGRWPQALNFFQSQPPRPRAFAHKSSLLLVARPTPRPQLPFLHPASRSNLIQGTLRSHIGRFITTETKARWQARLRWQLRFHAYLWPTLVLVVVLLAGIQHSRLERDYPTPRDWMFLSRWYLRTARYTELAPSAKVHRVLTDWGRAGYYYKLLLERLESEKYDGKFLMDQEEGGILVKGVGKTGFDISAKSEQWRRGYHEALMGAARTAEHLDGMCRRKGEERGRLYPRESIPGPANPRPKPLPWDKHGGHEQVPKEDEVEDAFPAPEVFYMKVMTTKGFDNRQRLDAALAYADWCDFKHLSGTAEEMYRWALDIAAAGLPQGAKDVVDMSTGIIKKGKEDVISQNLLMVTTALGVHYAREGEVRRALPILLSVLRARKTLPPKPPGLDDKKVKEQASGIWPYLIAFKDLMIEAPYPRPPPSGDEKPFHTLKEACEEVGLMTYIGEILFATSEREREKGLSWTRDSVEAAEAVMWVMDEQKEDEGKERCRECLQTGLQNWKAMAKQMARTASQKEKEVEKSPGWFGSGLGKTKQLDKARKDVQRWEEEERQIELRRQKTLPLIQPLKPTASGWVSV